MNTIVTSTFKTPLGELILGVYEQQLCLCDWKYRRTRSVIDQRITTQLKARFVEGDDPLLNAAKSQIQEYFAQKRRRFDIPLLLVGDARQIHVWEVLIQIPFGQTTNYQRIADSLQSERSVHAVARANGANALAIMVPCHRVLGVNEELLAYGGGLRAKKRLLLLEQQAFAF